MSKIPTAEELSKKYTRLRSAVALKDLSDFAIEFAKLHVEAALEEASEKALLRFENYEGTWEEQDVYVLDQYTNMKVSKDSILKAYPLTNIK